MIAASIMTTHAKLHWSRLYETNDMELVKLDIAQYMEQHYKDVPYTIHLSGEDGSIYVQQVQHQIFVSLN